MQIIFAILVAAGWYYYFTSVGAGAGTLLMLVALTLIAIWRLRRFHLAAGAAHNVVAAAATFKTLSEQDRARVHSRAIDIIRRSGWRGSTEPTFEDDAERYGFYALAMAELEISPVCLLKQWNFVRNPYREALNPPYYFTTSLQMAKRQGCEVLLQRPSHRE